MKDTLHLHDDDIETETLAGMVIDAKYRHYGLAHLTAEDFFSPKNQGIFEIVTRHANAPSLINMAVYKQFGAETVSRLLDQLPPSMETWCRELRGLAIHRRRVQMMQKILELKYDPTTKHTIETLIRQLADLNKDEIIAETTFADHVEQAFDDDTAAYDAFHKSEKPRGYPFFLPRLTETIGTILPGEFWIVAARPGMGKSTFILNMAKHGWENGERPLLVCMEMRGSDYLRKAACMETLTNSIAVRQGSLPAEKYLERTSYYDRLRKTCGADFLDVGTTTVDQLIPRIQAKVATHKSTAVFIDQLNNIAYGSLRPYEAMTNISNSVRGLAIDLNLPVIAVSQLNREMERRTKEGRREIVVSNPRLSDLRESGALEQDAVGVIMLNWPHKTDSLRPLNEYTVLVTKNRYGETGKLEDVKIYPDISLIKQEILGEKGPY